MGGKTRLYGMETDLNCDWISLKRREEEAQEEDGYLWNWKWPKAKKEESFSLQVVVGRG